MPTSTITSKGQTTVPKEVREALDLEPGGKLTWGASPLVKSTIPEIGLSRVEARVNKFKRERPRYLLGLGYVQFYAWHNAMQDNRTDVSSDVQRWAEGMLRVRQAGRAVAYEVQSAWAFAVNHCVYVGYTAGVQFSQAEEYRNQLVELKGKPALWHYRFADTIAVTHIKVANDRLKSY